MVSGDNTVAHLVEISYAVARSGGAQSGDKVTTASVHSLRRCIMNSPP
jgi:hypothetical protein